MLTIGRYMLGSSSIRFTMFEGESSAASGDAGTQTNPAATAGDKSNPNPNPAGGTQNPAQQQQAKVFTQEQVNALVAADKRKLRDQNEALARQLQEIQQTAHLTQEQRDELQTRIEQLQTQYQTEAEQKTSELKKFQTKYDTDTRALTTERDSWRKRFEQTSIARDIAAASAEHKAFSPSQIEAILSPATKMVETLDEGGKPTGIFEAKVDFTGVDKDGKEVKLQISVSEAVKRMTEMPDKYGNLFRDSGISGMAGSQSAASMNGGAIPNVDTMTSEEYKKHRDKIRAKMATVR